MEHLLHDAEIHLCDNFTQWLIEDFALIIDIFLISPFAERWIRVKALTSEREIGEEACGSCDDEEFSFFLMLFMGWKWRIQSDANLIEVSGFGLQRRMRLKSLERFPSAAAHRWWEWFSWRSLNLISWAYSSKIISSKNVSPLSSSLIRPCSWQTLRRSIRLHLLTVKSWNLLKLVFIKLGLF